MLENFAFSFQTCRQNNFLKINKKFTEYVSDFTVNCRPQSQVKISFLTNFDPSKNMSL